MLERSVIGKSVGISVSVFLILFLLGFFQEEKVSVEDVQNIETSEFVDSSNRAPSSLEKKDTISKELKRSSVNPISEFETPESFELLKKQVLESGSYISIKKQREDFQNSDFDSIQNAESAKILLLSAYPEEMDEEFVTQRVLATYFLKLSKHLNSEDCMRFTETVIQQYESAELESHKRALKFDMGSVAYMCSGIGGEGFHKRITKLNIPALKAQALTAIQVKREHRERSE